MPGLRKQHHLQAPKMGLPSTCVAVIVIPLKSCRPKMIVLRTVHPKIHATIHKITYCFQTTPTDPLHHLLANLQIYLSFCIGFSAHTAIILNIAYSPIIPFAHNTHLQSIGVPAPFREALYRTFLPCPSQPKARAATSRRAT